MLHVQHLAVFYSDVQALWDVSLQVNEGEIVTLLGANGAGKTTTLHAISGLLRARQGAWGDGSGLGKARKKPLQFRFCQVWER